MFLLAHNYESNETPRCVFISRCTEIRALTGNILGENTPGEFDFVADTREVLQSAEISMSCADIPFCLRKYSFRLAQNNMTSGTSRALS